MHIAHFPVYTYHRNLCLMLSMQSFWNKRGNMINIYCKFYEYKKLFTCSLKDWTLIKLNKIANLNKNSDLNDCISITKNMCVSWHMRKELSVRWLETF